VYFLNKNQEHKNYIYSQKNVISCGGNPSTGGKNTTKLHKNKKYPKAWG